MFFLIENFLTAEQCDGLIAEFRHIAGTANIASDHFRVSATRTELTARALTEAPTSDVRAQIRALHERLSEVVNSLIAKTDRYFIEFTIFTEMKEGDSHRLHADSERERSDGTWEPNHTPFRDYTTTMLYLNSSGLDYEGGILNFPALGQQIVPKAGLLVGFECGRGHIHEVLPIARGSRFAISIWYTKDPGRTERLSQ